MTNASSQRWPRSVVRTLALPLALVAPTTQVQPPDTSTNAVVAATAAYVAEYQHRLTSVLADETYSQAVITARPPDVSRPSVRRMRSEVFFMFVPGNHDWMAIRDVIAIDGAPVGSRPDIQHALRTLPTRDVAATFKDHNSRYNIGRTQRNFNEPTLSLLVFDANHRRRFSFKRTRIERDGDTIVVTLRFTEKESPTLIRDLRRGRVLSTGEVVVEAGTGRVRRAVLEAETDDVKVELATTYAPDERLGMWVPALFRERYEHRSRSTPKGRAPRSDYEQITCEARYSNFRRFETGVRIR